MDVQSLFDATDGSPDYLHTPIPTNPVLDTNSGAMLTAANVPSNVPRAGGDGSWQTPVYVAHATDPSYTPTFSEPWGCSVGGSINIPDQATRETPDATAGGDAWIMVANVDDGTAKGIWQASKSTGTWNGSCGGSFPIHGNGFNPAVGVGTGSGSQIGAGAILLSELACGHIDHALYSASTITCSSFREPATKSDGHGTGTTCFPEGTRIQLDPAVHCDTLGGAAGEAMICHALQTYGVYILDSGGGGPLGFYIQGDDLTDPNRSPWQTPGDPSRGGAGCSPVSATCGIAANVGLVGGSGDLADIPWSRLRVLAHWDGT